MVGIHVNRRKFLEALVAVGASAILAETLAARASEALDSLASSTHVMRPPAGVALERILQIVVSSAEEVSRHAEWGCRRIGDGEVNGKWWLYRSAMNAYYGCQSLILPPGGEWITTEWRPSHIEVFGDVDAALYALAETSDGRLHHYFFQLSRGRSPRLLEDSVCMKPRLVPDIDEDKLYSWELE
jgi:hypothetical protein